MIKPDACEGCVFYNAPDKRWCGPDIQEGATVLFVAERPGETELRTGIPLNPDGKSGFHARKAFEGKKVGVSNVLKCAGRPGAGPEEMEQAMEHCVREYLNKEIAEMKPKHVVMIGGLSFKAVMDMRNVLRFHGTHWTRREADILRGAE